MRECKITRHYLEQARSLSDAKYLTAVKLKEAGFKFDKWEPITCTFELSRNFKSAYNEADGSTTFFQWDPTPQKGTLH